MNASHFSGTWRMALAMALSGTIGLAVVESGQAPLVVVFFRCLIGGAAMILGLTLTRGWKPMKRSDVLWLAIGGLSLVFNWLLLFTAYKHSSISIATVVYHTQPFMLLALVALLQGEPLQRSRMPWLVLAFLGVVLITEVLGGESYANWLGVLLACAAAFLYAVATMVTRRLKHLPPAQIASFQMAIGVVLLLPLAAPTLPVAVDLRGAMALVMLGLVHTAFMYTIMYSAFQRLPAQSIAALSFIYPVVALLVDLLFYQVRLSSMQMLGMAAILLAVVADQRNWNLRVLFQGRKTVSPGR